jgi:serine/threonine protein kinase
MKAKVVCRIALALRFSHSLGFFHGNLNSNNILFDNEHHIQITDFGNLKFEVEVEVEVEHDENASESERERESESGVGGIFYGTWIGQSDIRAFGSLLLEIIIGYPLTLPVDANSDGLVNQEVREFVSEMIESMQSEGCQRFNSFDRIVKILKRNNFQIEPGVD